MSINEIKQEQKYYEFTCLLNCYVKALLQNKSVADELHKKGINNVAIYGMSFLGERVLEDCKREGIKVLYAIDQRADELDVNIPVYLLSDNMPQVDAYIVTTAYEYDVIKERLMNKVAGVPIYSIKELIYGLA